MADVPCEEYTFAFGLIRLMSKSKRFVCAVCIWYTVVTCLVHIVRFGNSLNTGLTKLGHRRVREKEREGEREGDGEMIINPMSCVS